MKIKMLVSVAGDGFGLDPGDVTDRFSQAEALRMIEKGYAVPFAVRDIETAVAVASERRGPRRSRKVA